MDHLKPQYHYMPEKNWMNDPVGLYFDGQWYHMFYQYNPHGDQWGSIHWGHCRSKDLLHWEERPVALAPHIDQGEQHCFSGSLVVSDRKNPLIFYTRIPFGKKAVSHNAEQWVARGDENLENWPHSGKTPLITNSIHGETDRVIDWRDPFVFRAYNHWYMLLGGSLNGDGVILLYRSEDLENWTYRCILLTDSEEAPFLECPNLILDNEKAILLYSPANKPVRYMTGEFTEEERFIADHQSILDNSAMEGLYAPQMARDKEESIYMIGWAPEESRSNSSIIRGYSGAQTLPRRITIEDDGSLNIAPHRICETLRKTHRQLLCQNQKQSEILINEKGRQWELCLDMDLNPENKKKKHTSYNPLL
jgi:beta-fructofuranosidase